MSAKAMEANTAEGMNPVSLREKWMCAGSTVIAAAAQSAARESRSRALPCAKRAAGASTDAAAVYVSTSSFRCTRSPRWAVIAASVGLVKSMRGSARSRE